MLTEASHELKHGNILNHLVAQNLDHIGGLRNFSSLARTTSSPYYARTRENKTIFLNLI